MVCKAQKRQLGSKRMDCVQNGWTALRMGGLRFLRLCHLDCKVLTCWTATRRSPWLSMDCAGVLWTAPRAVQTKVGLQQLGHHGLHNFAELPCVSSGCMISLPSWLEPWTATSNHGLQPGAVHGCWWTARVSSGLRLLQSRQKLDCSNSDTMDCTNFAELPSCRVACRVGSNHGLQLW